MTFLVSAVTGARARSLIEAGLPWLGGYVVRGQDLASGLTVAALHEELGLSFPGSPFDPAAPSLDILRLPVTGTVQLASPGSDAPAFVDHSPLSGTGFVESASGFVPYWWMAPSPIPAGTTLWRVYADGREEALATYAHIALGWVGPSPQQQLRPTPVRFPEMIGTWATIAGNRFLADTLPDGSIIVCSPVEQEGMLLSPRGIWWKSVASPTLDSMDVVRVTATLDGRPVQIVGMEAGDGGPNAHIVYTGHNAHDAESMNLAKTAAGVYEAIVPLSSLSNAAETRTDVALQAAL